MNEIIQENTTFKVSEHRDIEVNCPNYLINISTLSECFSEFGFQTHILWQKYFISQIKPFIPDYHTHKGNIVNDLLDEIIHTPKEKLDFKKFMLSTFRKRPLEYSSILEDDIKFSGFYNEIKIHFQHLTSIVYNDFLNQNIAINTDEVILEPSFINEKLGIQGRLDLLQISPQQLKIIELKSGKTPFPTKNKKKVSANHAAQAQLYHLLIDKLKIFSHKKKKKNIVAICYSSAERTHDTPPNNLRFISHNYNPNFFKEVMKLRNFIINQIISVINSEEDETIAFFFKQLQFSQTNIKLNESLSWFRRDYDELENIISSMEAPVRSYFFAFYRFILLEQFLSKVGNQNTLGQSALWRKNENSTPSIKEENTSINEKYNNNQLLSIKDHINHLKVKEIKIEEQNFTITLQRETDQNINEMGCFDFRKGDTCILYKKEGNNHFATDGQLTKCTLSSTLNKDNELTLYFRHKQNNKFIAYFFNKKDEWILEHDFLDIGFIAMIRGLYSLGSASKQRQELLLGITPPKIEETQTKYEILDKISNESSKKEIVKLSEKILSSKDYFLLSGPPGTGKTKIVIKNLIKHLSNHTNEKILLLAYTNQAVNELCEAILSASKDFKRKTHFPFIRVGSIFSADSTYEPYFIQNITKKIDENNNIKRKRKELHSILSQNYIYVGTLSSIQQNNLLFTIIKKFDTCIIDEASQILEPQIIDILTKSRRFILIGDEKQLPSISHQTATQAQRFNFTLKEKINMISLQHSYFERMIRNAKQKGWNYCIGTLTYQGRMHDEISLFPNKNFYNNILKSIGLTHQTEKNIFHINHSLYQNSLIKMGNQIHKIRDLLLHHRILFINCPLEQGKNLKTHDLQASIIVKLIQQLSELEKLSDESNCDYNVTIDKELKTQHSIGIITIYRNQISKIISLLNKTAHSLNSLIVDTVERYQGSQKDHIIISLSINSIAQLEFLRKDSEEHYVDENYNAVILDKKLNVMLTRARKQVILLGNENLLSFVPIYKKLLEHIKKNDSFVQYSDII